MNFEPQKIFVGLLDFFAIWLPGAMLTYFLMDTAGPILLGGRYYTLGGAEAWIIFLFSAFLLGHFVFVAGSLLLDELIYDRLRSATTWGQTLRLVQGRKLQWRLTRWLARYVVRDRADRTVRHTLALKDRYLARLRAPDAINTFQWSKARLALDHPNALADVHRYEADSKFFRSLAIVLLILVPIAFVTDRNAIGWVGLVFLGFAIWRYSGQRFKATDQAYWYVLTAECQSAEPSVPPARSVTAPWSHAGGVVVGDAEMKGKYLLVRPQDGEARWVLPKGKIKAWEQPEETAIREVREESGVWGRIRAPLGTLSFSADNGSVSAMIFLIVACELGSPTEEREAKWFTFAEAMREELHSGTRAALATADEKMRRSA